jgi:4-oxalomesaconate hydratase
VAPMSGTQNVLVISAHAVDFLWRCGGAIARYAQAGHQVRIIDLTFGERGESAEVWKGDNSLTENAVKEVRRREAVGAAKVLGAEIRFLDFGDHPLIMNKEHCLTIVDELRDFRPQIVLTHHTKDPLNPDHEETTKAYLWALRCAQVPGVKTQSPSLGRVRTCMFEPDQPEFCDFKADTFIDITDVMDLKKQAMRVVESQSYLYDNFVARAQLRGYFAQKACADKSIKYVEAFQRFEPYFGKEFV